MIYDTDYYKDEQVENTAIAQKQEEADIVEDLQREEYEDQKAEREVYYHECEYAPAEGY